MMPIILWLLLVHFLIDWCWQGDFIANNKHKMWQVMFSHCAAWSLGICAVLSFFGLFAWWKLAMLFIGHWIEDLWKAKKVARINDREVYSEEWIEVPQSVKDSIGFTEWRKRYFSKLLCYDQGFHFIQILACLI